MGAASLVLGIVSLLGVPFLGALAILPATVGFALGLTELVLRRKKGKQTGAVIAGIVLSATAVRAAVLLIAFMTFVPQ